MTHPNIQTEELIIGDNVDIHESVIIRGLQGKAKKIVLGDNIYIGANVQILCDNFSLGDYSRIQHSTTIHGYKPCIIGHNAWIGQSSIIDSIGGTTIGNNCGIGAHSQLWSHIRYGDTLEGCRFNSGHPMNIGNDVWFVGHCIVSPITAADKSMAMVGSVVAKDMEYNTIYGGCPAKAVSDKLGFQFAPVPVEEKLEKMKQYIIESKIDASKIKVVSAINDFNADDSIAYFDVMSRQYTKKKTVDEIAFMKYLLPVRAKFVPFAKTL
ncbi:MAG: hypothetical protein ABIT08_07770 [Bacteroidia bacterium]